MNYLKNILSSLDQKYFGLIWPIGQKEIPFDETFQTVDYLCDGVLTKLVSKDDLNRSKSHMIVSTQFGHPFWILVTPNAENEILAELDKIVPLAKQLQGQEAQIAIIENGTLGKQFMTKIKNNFEKKFPGCQANSIY